MSDLKVDGIIASTGSNTNLTLEGKGTGGVKITDYLVQTKGSDVSSATALTLGKDGNFFDVTGTTTITSIGTQGIGSCVTLQFDGALTFTHHSTDLVLPGAANITTAAGDIAVMYEYASGDRRCVSYTKASGAAVVAGGGAWNIIATSVASDSASLTITGLDSTYDTYAIAVSDMHPATDDASVYFRFGDSSGIDDASDDYDYVWTMSSSDSTTHDVNKGAASKTFIQVADTVGTAAGDFFGGIYYIHRPGDGTSRPFITGHGAHTRTGNAEVRGGALFAMRNAVITLDRIQFLFSNGNIATGRMTVWGIAHA